MLILLLKISRFQIELQRKQLKMSKIKLLINPQKHLVQYQEHFEGIHGDAFQGFKLTPDQKAKSYTKYAIA